MFTSQDATLGSGHWASLRLGILRRLHHRLRGLPEAAIEDAAQDVLLALHLHLRRHGPPRRLDALVCVLCRRRAASVIRRARLERRHFVGDPALLAAALDPGPGPESRLLDEDRARALRRALARPDAQRERFAAIAAGRMRGLSHETIAAGLGLSAAATRQAWHRLRVRTRIALDRAGAGLADEPGAGGVHA